MHHMWDILYEQHRRVSEYLMKQSRNCVFGQGCLLAKGQHHHDVLPLIFILDQMLTLMLENGKKFNLFSLTINYGQGPTV